MRIIPDTITRARISCLPLIISYVEPGAPTDMIYRDILDLGDTV